jgi:hypothetical protein
MDGFDFDPSSLTTRGAAADDGMFEALTGTDPAGVQALAEAGLSHPGGGGAATPAAAGQGILGFH